MRIAFRQANPRSHNESVLLCVDVLGEPTQCLLFDAGDGVALDDLLADDDAFLGACLSHAHSDHYDTLDDVRAVARRRENADPTVYTSPDTAAVLGDVLDIAAAQRSGETDSERSGSAGDVGRDGPAGDDERDRSTAGAVRAVDDWTRLSEWIELRPVPAGHAPGAVGFLVRISDGDDERLCLVTGDWTLRDAGGTPGLPVEELPQVDVLFLTTATATGVSETLTDVVATTLERASAGAPTLVTANGLTGAHLARLLDRAANGFGIQVPVRVVGHTARLYRQLYGAGATATDGGSEVIGDGSDPGGVETAAPTDSAVECVPVFDSPGTCLGPGEITVAGPDVPTEQSSGTLFDTLANNPNACVYQVIGSGRTPRDDADCTLHSAELANHPAPATLETVVDELAPRHTVIVHERGASGKYNYLDSMVWAGDSDELFELYDGHSWQMPPWTTQSVLRTDDSEGYQGVVPTLPSPRGGRVDLEREGLDLDALSERLHASYDPDLGRTAESGSSDTETAVATDAGRSRSTDTALTGADVSDSAETDSSGSTGTDSSDSTGTDTSDSTGTDTSDSTEIDTHSDARDDTSETVSASERRVAVSPVAVGLAERVAAQRGESVETVVTDAVGAYLRALLSGAADGTAQEAIVLDATVSDGFRTALGAEGDTDGSTLVETVVGSALAPDSVGETLPLPNRGLTGGGIDAVVDNDSFELDTPAAVVEAAVCWDAADSDS